MCVLASIFDVGGAVYFGGAFELVCVELCVGVEGKGVFKPTLCMDCAYAGGAVRVFVFAYGNA